MSDTTHIKPLTCTVLCYCFTVLYYCFTVCTTVLLFSNTVLLFSTTVLLSSFPLSPVSTSVLFVKISVIRGQSRFQWPASSQCRHWPGETFLRGDRLVGAHDSTVFTNFVARPEFGLFLELVRENFLLEVAPDKGEGRKEGRFSQNSSLSGSVCGMSRVCFFQIYFKQY